MIKRIVPLSVIAVLLGIIPLLTNSGFWLDSLITVLIFAVFATGWNMAGGMTGLFSLGHAALFAMGAYIPALLQTFFAVPVLLGILLAALAAVLTSLLIGLMSLRLKGHYFALATLGLGALVTIVLANLHDVTGGDEGISLSFDPDPMSLVFASKVPYLYMALGLYVVTALATIALHSSKLGYQMKAIREDEVTARSMGVPALRTKLLAVCLSGFFSALAGSLFAQYTLYITPANTSSIDVSLQPALMAIIGGMASVFGPLVGAFIIILLEQQVITTIGADIAGLSTGIYGGLLVVSILLLPNGLIGVLRMSTLRSGRRWISPLFAKKRDVTRAEKPAEDSLDVPGGDK